MLIVLWFYMLLIVANCDSESSTIPPEEDDFTEIFYQWVNTENVTEYRDLQTSFTQKYMNLSLDPCENFYEYACGNWRYVVPVRNPQRYSVGKVLQEMQDFVLSRLFWVEVDTEDKETTVKLKQFFESCVDEVAWKYEEFLNILDTGSWPLTDSNWTADSFDWLNTTAEVHALNVRVLFKLSTKYSAEGILTNYFSPLERMPYRDFKNDRRFSDKQVFVEAIKAQLKMFSIEGGGKEDMLEEVYEFAEDLIRVESECHCRESKLAYLKVDDMPVKFPSLNFEHYFSILRNQEQVSTLEKIFIYDWECLNDIFERIQAASPRTVANYILINTLLYYYTVMNYASQGLQNCGTIVKEHMLSAAVDLYVDYYFDNETEHGIKDTFENVRLASTKLISSSDWLGSDVKDTLQKDFVSFHQKVGYSDGFLNATKLKAEYHDLRADPKNFIKNLMNVFRNSLRNKQKRIGQKGLEMKPFKIGLSFEEKTRTLEVPVGFLAPPFFHKYSTGFANYAGLAAHATAELIKNFDAEKTYEEAKGEDWRTTRVGETHLNNIECFRSQLASSDNNTTTNYQNATIIQNMADTVGLKIALIAYRDWLKKNKESSLVDDGLRMSDGSTLSNIQAFFLSYTQNLCSISNKKGSTDDQAQATPKLLSAIVNSKEFSDAFGCPAGSPMNSVKKCGYFNPTA